jgi:ABC-type uncharacterized transport system involved in gliding motility auxiliary subunit
MVMTKIGLLFIGITLSVAGIVAAEVADNWSITPTMLLILGIALCLLGLWLWGNEYKFWQRRSTKEGIGAIAKTAIALAIIGLINWVGISYNQRWDFTENLVHTLSAQSQTIVSNLKQPLEVFIFDHNINPKLANLLQNYRDYSDKFQFKLINPEQEIGLAQKFGVQSLGEIYLQYGNKRQKLNTGNAALGETLNETRLTNGIAKIKRDRPNNIYLLQGHGEASLEPIEGGLGQSIKNLEDKGNHLQSLNLASTGKIPDNADLIMIAGGTRKLLAAEVSSLQQYLKTSGNLLLLLSPNADINITPILQNWGIELDQRLIVNGSGAGGVMDFDPAVAIVNNYGKHPITASFGNGISLFPEARPLKILAKAGILSTPLAITSQQTWAESDLRSEQITFDQTKDIPGPLYIAIASEREQPKPSRLVIFGSSTFATNGWFEQQLNGDILLNSISWLVGEDRDPLSIRPKEAANRRINLSSLQAFVISWLAIRIMPFMALVIAVYLWWKRR